MTGLTSGEFARFCVPGQVYYRKAYADAMPETMKSAHPPPTYLPTYPNKEVTHPNIGTPYLPWYQPPPTYLPTHLLGSLKHRYPCGHASKTYWQCSEVFEVVSWSTYSRNAHHIWARWPENMHVTDV
jgi:hypothetical protein